MCKGTAEYGACDILHHESLIGSSFTELTCKLSHQRTKIANYT